MEPLQIVPSTTSHKHEALDSTLAVFARLGFADIDLNLNHIVERGAEPGAVRAALDANRQRAPVVSGGWCDFFEDGAGAEQTRASVDRQAALARGFGGGRLRLFFGRLPADRYTPHAREVCVRNIRRVAESHPDLLLVFENHDGASSRPDICRAILEGVDRPNVRLTFDPINFEYRGVPALTALAEVQPLVGHVHLKGYAAGAFCGFGEGDVDLMPTLRRLIEHGYCGGFTVEYEGRGDRTVRLYESVERARQSIARLRAQAD